MNHLFTLNRYFKKYRVRLLLGILFVTISNFFGILPAQLIRKAIDETQAAFRLADAASGFNPVFSNVATLVLMIIGFTLLKGLFMFMMRQTIIVMSRHIEYDQKNEIYNHYQKLGLSFYQRETTGDMVNRISEDVSRVRMYTGPAIMYTINLSVMFILVFAAMLQVNSLLAVYVIVPLPLMSLLIYYVHDRINRKSERVQAKLSDISAFIQETFSGIRLVRSFNRNESKVDEMNRLSEDYKTLSAGLNKTNALFMPLLMLLIGLSIIMIVFIGGRNVMTGAMTIGNLAEFVVYVNMLTWPVASLGWVVSLIQQAAASQERINAYLSQKPDIISDTTDPFELKGEIEFRAVRFTWPGTGVQAVKDVSFRTEKGRMLGITGRTGSGKSTLAALMLRLADADRGAILIDGRDLRNINLSDYRNQSGYVPQDAFLFSDTIRNNIAFGAMKPVSQDEIEKAASAAALDAEIRRFTEGYDTVIGERGITLSGGQKQRLAIARALIRKPRLLILDDCLSAVDSSTENVLIQNLMSFTDGMTVVIISHRVSAIRNADEIIVLENGIIAERGTHSALVRQKGIYSGMYELQQAESSPIS